MIELTFKHSLGHIVYLEAVKAVDNGEIPQKRMNVYHARRHYGIGSFATFLETCSELDLDVIATFNQAYFHYKKRTDSHDRPV